MSPVILTGAGRETIKAPAGSSVVTEQAGIRCKYFLEFGAVDKARFNALLSKTRGWKFDVIVELRLGVLASKKAEK